MTTVSASRPPFRRVAVMSAVLLAVSAGIAGCAGGGSDGQTVLRVQFEQGETSSAAAQAFAEGFEAANPNVEIKLESVSSEAKTTTNSTVLTSGNPPDVGLLPSNGATFGALAAKGAILDLADVWKAADLDKRYAESVNQANLYNGKHYSLITDSCLYSIVYYNKALFEKAGLTAPADHRITSPDQLYQMAAGLRKIGVQPLAFAGKSGSAQPTWMIDALLPTAATPEQMTNYLQSWQADASVTARYTDDPFNKTLGALADYAKNGVYQEGFLGTDKTATESAFATGSAGMALGGHWTAGTLRDDGAPFDFGWMLLPPVDSTRTAQLTGCYIGTMVIPAGAQNQELAKKYLEHMVSNEAQRDAVVKAAHGLPAVTGLPDSAFDETDPIVKEMLEDIRKNGTQSGWTSTVPGSLGQSFSSPLVLSMYAGETTPDAIGAQVQAQLDKVRGR